MRQKRQPSRGQRKSSRQTCPNCHALMQDDDIICVACGTNLLTGQRIGEEVAVVQETHSNPVLLYIVSGVIIVGLVAGAFLLFLTTRNPVTKALRLIEEGQYLEAQDVLTNYKNLQDDEFALFELARLQWLNSNKKQAALTFERVVRLDPDNVEAALMTVVCLGSHGDASVRDRQILMLERALEVEPENPSILYTLAMARALKRDTKGQIEALEKILTLGSLDDSARWSLGVGLALQGDTAAADRELSLVGEGARLADALAVRGFLMSDAGNDAVAMERLLAAVERDDLSVQWQVHTQLGKMFIERGQFADAAHHLERAIRLGHNNELARYLRGVSRQAQGQFQEALSDFEALSKARGPMSGPAAIEEARAHIAQGNNGRAEEALQRVPTNKRSGAKYHTVRGLVHARAGDDTAARRSFRSAISADPSYAAAYLEQGLLHVRSDQLIEGVRDLERYIQLVGPETQGTRIREIRALTEQLRQTTGSTNRGGMRASALGERVSL